MSRRAAAPKLAPTLLDGPPVEAPPEPRARARNFEAEVEVIRTPCGRVIERTAVVVELKIPGDRWVGDRKAEVIRSISHDNTYRLWEPVLEGASYSITRTTAGHTWGLAHTRNPREKLTEHQDAVAWEMQQEARAMGVIRANCPELAGKVSDGTFEVCGMIRLLGNPKIRAAQVDAARRAR